MRPDRQAASLAVAVLTLVLVAGCSRVTFLKPDVSRGDFRRTAPEVDIRSDSSGRVGAVALVQAANSRLVGGDAKGALAAAQRAVKSDASLAEAHSLVGLSLDALGRGEESGAHHRRAAELAPTQGGLLNNYGTWLCANGRAAESLGWFERAVSSPGYATPVAALGNGGTCALRAGELDRAAAWLRQALAVEPTAALALRTLAEVELKRGRGLEARAFIERRLAVAPADAESLLLASQIEKVLGDTAASTRYVHRLRAEFPRTPDSASEGGNP